MLYFVKIRTFSKSQNFVLIKIALQQKHFFHNKIMSSQKIPMQKKKMSEESPLQRGDSFGLSKNSKNKTKTTLKNQRFWSHKDFKFKWKRERCVSRGMVCECLEMSGGIPSV